MKANEALIRTLFIETIDGVYKCNSCGTVRKQKKNTGWSNLLDHVKTAHADFFTRFKDGKNSGEMHQTQLKEMFKICYPKTTTNLFGWIKWVVHGLKPFNFVEDPLNRENSKLDGISRNTLIKHLELLTLSVEKKISQKIESKFALVMDGWSTGSTHYLALFAVFDNKEDRETVLLAFSPFVDETNFGAKNHADFIKWVVESVYGKNMSDVISLTGDNCSTNVAVSRILSLPLLGCASHKFDLALSEFIVPWKPLINKIHILMTKLNTLKLSGKLRKLTPLRPKTYTLVRWSSANEMVNRYLEIKEFIVKVFSEERCFDLLLSKQDDENVIVLSQHLRKFDSVVKKLQSHDITLGETRFLFNQFISIYPDFAKYLAHDSHVVQDPIFESAILKLQNGKEDQLTGPETEKVKSFKTDDAVIEQVDTENFADMLMNNRQKRSQYKNTSFLPVTSNAAERLFSVAGYTLNDYRQRLLPSNFEMQIFLFFNKKYWDIETLQNVIC